MYGGFAAAGNARKRKSKMNSGTGRRRRYAKSVQLYQSRTNRSSATAKALLSLHFLFQDLTQYQE